MKLRDYFLLSIVVSTVFACSSDDDAPEVHVFTPDATLSLTAEVNGATIKKSMDGITKAAGAKAIAGACVFWSGRWCTLSDWSLHDNVGRG